MKEKATVYFLNTNTRLHQYNLYYCQRVSLIYPDCSRMSFFCLDYGIACTLLGLFSGRALLCIALIYLYHGSLAFNWIGPFLMYLPLRKEKMRTRRN
jgi:hypothetical protein